MNYGLLHTCVKGLNKLWVKNLDIQLYMEMFITIENPVDRIMVYKTKISVAPSEQFSDKNSDKIIKFFY